MIETETETFTEAFRNLCEFLKDASFLKEIVPLLVTEWSDNGKENINHRTVEQHVLQTRRGNMSGDGGRRYHADKGAVRCD
jgi:hypothetical protein